MLTSYMLVFVRADIVYRCPADAEHCGAASQGLRWTQAPVDGHMFPRLRLQVRVGSEHRLVCEGGHSVNGGGTWMH